MRQRSFIRNRTARTAGTILATIVLFLAAAAAAAAQSYFSIQVTGNRNIAFGTLFRSSTSAVSYTSSNAAEFSLIGLQTGKVRITVTTSNPVRNTVPLAMTVTQLDCAYSLNNGSTWTRFTTGTLFQDTWFPIDDISGFLRGTIKVRVGGLVTSTSHQQRGLYTGSITVSAVYR